MILRKCGLISFLTVLEMYCNKINSNAIHLLGWYSNTAGLHVKQAQLESTINRKYCWGLIYSRLRSVQIESHIQADIKWVMIFIFTNAEVTVGMLFSFWGSCVSIFSFRWISFIIRPCLDTLYIYSNLTSCRQLDLCHRKLHISLLCSTLYICSLTKGKLAGQAS